jgi:hypothetical protein
MNCGVMMTWLINIKTIKNQEPIIYDVYVLSIYLNNVCIIRLSDGMTPKSRHNKSRTTTYLMTIKQKWTLYIKPQRIEIFLMLKGGNYKRERKDPQIHYVL